MKAIKCIKCFILDKGSRKKSPSTSGSATKRGGGGKGRPGKENQHFEALKTKNKVLMPTKLEGVGRITSGGTFLTITFLRFLYSFMYIYSEL